MKPTTKFKKMATMYLRFSKDWPLADTSDAALNEMFFHESLGTPLTYSRGVLNAYALGKKWMDVNVAMWKEDIAQSTLFVFELQKEYPDWFLSRVGVLDLQPNPIASRWLLDTEASTTLGVTQ
jgi:hypothetical protein